MHRDLNTILRALVADHGDPYNWEDLLPSTLFALRTAICRSTGLALYQILFGRDCSSLIDNIFREPSDNLDEPGIMDYLQKLHKHVLAAEAQVLPESTSPWQYAAKGASTTRKGKTSMQEQRYGSSHPR